MGDPADPGRAFLARYGLEHAADARRAISRLLAAFATDAGAARTPDELAALRALIDAAGHAHRLELALAQAAASLAAGEARRG